MPSLSYQEKSLYVSLAIELAVYGPYFLLHRQNTINNIAGVIVSIIVLQIILQSIVAAFSRNRLTDERDKLIELRGYRVGYLTVISLMIMGLGMLWFHATFLDLHMDGRALGLHFLNVFFAILVLGEIAKTTTQLIVYRREA